MQDNFLLGVIDVQVLRGTLSEARFSTYLKLANNDPILAARLYHWNIRLSQSLYLPIHIWEISLRNRLNIFLSRRWSKSWPYDNRAERGLHRAAKLKLTEVKDRLNPQRKQVNIPTNEIVADLSAGFWVGLLANFYDIQFSWRYNLATIYPYLPQPDRATIASEAEEILVLRNRVAHHEPILTMDLERLHATLAKHISGMCTASSVFLKSECNFSSVWNSRPETVVANDDQDAEAVGAPDEGNRQP